MTAVYYENGNNDKSDNNKDKVCLLLKDDVGGSYVRSRPRLYNPESCDYGVTLLIKMNLLKRYWIKILRLL